EISRVVIDRSGVSRKSRAAFQPLLADVESLDQVRVAMRVLCFQIVEQPAAPADEHEQTASRVMIFRVCLEMLGEVIDSFAQDSDLYFWRTCVAFMRLVAADEFSLPVFAECQLRILHERSRTSTSAIDTG